ncbi:MAG: type II toxin-antitoxin system death-on-curing family toxin [Chloroflexota bacterium]|nr:type II toxin-antitoxin system death-on-curing family toxin [Chloroflexota bacterium]
MSNYLTLLDVVAIHERVMRAGGYQPRPLLRPELLESALYRPQQAAYYEEADTLRQGALLAVSFSEAQVFEDGNKTTAFACLDVFLRDNGYLLHRAQRAVADALIAIANDREGRKQAVMELEVLLRENSRPTEEHQ